MRWRKKKGQEVAGEQWKPLVKAYLMSSKLDPKEVARVNRTLDEVSASEEKVDYQYQLAGEIRRGEQLQLQPDDPRLAGLVSHIDAMARRYILRFFGEHPIGPPLTADRIQPTLQDVWGVYQRAHDYNPLHNHGTQSRMGISGVCYIQVPECIRAGGSKGVISGTGAQGRFDGHLYLNYGELRPFGSIMLEPPLTMQITPQEGVMLMWPAWLNHGVWPFDGDGERRCVAFNINVVITPPKG